MNIKSILISTLIAISALNTNAQQFIGKQTPEMNSDRMTPEVLWSMGRIGSFNVSPDGNNAVYTVTYYSVEENKSHSVIYMLNLNSKTPTLLTTSTKSEYSPVFIKNGKKIVFLSSESGTSQLWEMNYDGSERRQLSFEADDISEFLFSPDEQHVIIIKEVETDASIAKNDSDLPKASGMVINDLMYKHWDTYVKTIPHPFVASFDGDKVQGSTDVLEGEPYECPMMPFGGIEQLAWSPDSKTIAYTCRKKVGKAYAISTDSDIFLYDITTKSVKNLCKQADWVDQECDSTMSLEHQAVNNQKKDNNVGYDQNPAFSPDGKRIAWLSMERDGYESDRTRLCVYEFATGNKTYVTESFESGVDQFLWMPNSKDICFSGVWHGKTQIYTTNLEGKVKPLTDEVADFSLVSIAPNGKDIFCKKHSMKQADEVYLLKEKNLEQITFENKHIYDCLTLGNVEERWVSTTDGKKELCWVVYPPHFDANKKYPALLFCEGGPQSPVSQFWSYRWNFQIMAANEYIIIAPNRRGLPGFGMEWLEQISGDYSGQCMRDLLSAIDDLKKEPYVDENHLGAVGASFGGYSVYWLAGNHDKRFKAFIAHDGIYNTQQQYVETEEMWFPNWDLKSAPWIKNAEGQMQKAFRESPHLFVDKWDTPILCIHGQKDFRIEYTQAESAFNAARLRGIPAQLLLFPDENHWVLKPQNGILWQRTFFRWLDRWLKPDKK